MGPITVMALGRTTQLGRAHSDQIVDLQADRDSAS